MSPCRPKMLFCLKVERSTCYSLPQIINWIRRTRRRQHSDLPGGIDRSGAPERSAGREYYCSCPPFNIRNVTKRGMSVKSLSLVMWYIFCARSIRRSDESSETETWGEVSEFKSKQAQSTPQTVNVYPNSLNGTSKEGIVIDATTGLLRLIVRWSTLWLCFSTPYVPFPNFCHFFLCHEIFDEDVARIINYF